jgi:hypothetical protein
MEGPVATPVNLENRKMWRRQVINPLDFCGDKNKGGPTPLADGRLHPLRRSSGRLFFNREAGTL